jgi:hypothetical protein
MFTVSDATDEEQTPPAKAASTLCPTVSYTSMTVSTLSLFLSHISALEVLRKSSSEIHPFAAETQRSPTFKCDPLSASCFPG